MEKTLVFSFSFVCDVLSLSPLVCVCFKTLKSPIYTPLDVHLSVGERELKKISLIPSLCVFMKEPWKTGFFFFIIYSSILLIPSLCDFVKEPYKKGISFLLFFLLFLDFVSYQLLFFVLVPFLLF